MKLHMDIHNEIHAIMVPYHRKEESCGKSVKWYFGIVLSFVRQSIIWTKNTW